MAVHHLSAHIGEMVFPIEIHHATFDKATIAECDLHIRFIDKSSPLQAVLVFVFSAQDLENTRITLRIMKKIK